MSNRRFAIFTLLMVVFISLLILNDIRDRSGENDVLQIALLPEAKYGNEWEQVIAGANQAANEYGVELKLLAPDYARTHEEQLELLIKSREQGMDGIVIAPVDPQASGELIVESVGSGTPLISIVKSMKHLGVVESYSADQYMIGQDLAALVIDAYGSACTTTLLIPDAQQTWLTQRELGYRDYMERYVQVDITDNYRSRGDIYSAANTTASLLLAERPDVIVCLDHTMTIGAASVVEISELVTKVVGIDMSDETINHIDSGVIAGVVAQDYFSMGYLSVQAMVEYIADNQPITGQVMRNTTITSDNLYSKEIQMVFFSIE